MCCSELSCIALTVVSKIIQRKGGKREGRKKGRKEGRKEGRREGGKEIPSPCLTESRVILNL